MYDVQECAMIDSIGFFLAFLACFVFHTGHAFLFSKLVQGHIANKLWHGGRKST
jgi:hypothetical protein